LSAPFLRALGPLLLDHPLQGFDLLAGRPLDLLNPLLQLLRALGSDLGNAGTCEQEAGDPYCALPWFHSHMASPLEIMWHCPAVCESNRPVDTKRISPPVSERQVIVAPRLPGAPRLETS
jgi:hypothetical protein